MWGCKECLVGTCLVEIRHLGGAVDHGVSAGVGFQAGGFL